MQPSQHTGVTKIMKHFFEGTETATITLHNKSTILSPAHTYIIKTVCTEGGNREII
jgi:hypothetical protein